MKLRGRKHNKHMKKKICDVPYGDIKAIDMTLKKEIKADTNRWKHIPCS